MSILKRCAGNWQGIPSELRDFWGKRGLLITLNSKCQRQKQNRYCSVLPQKKEGANWRCPTLIQGCSGAGWNTHQSSVTGVELQHTFCGIHTVCGWAGCSKENIYMYMCLSIKTLEVSQDFFSQVSNFSFFACIDKHSPECGCGMSAWTVFQQN